MNSSYRKQVELLLRILPCIAEHPDFALKGGTAINLFERPMPRLSVDIDLTYLPLQDRRTSLESISSQLHEISCRCEDVIPGVRATFQESAGGEELKLYCNGKDASVKIEVNGVLRGHVWPVRRMILQEFVQESFDQFVVMPVLSEEELYGGKICAALDRQHPRDLFDIKILFDEGKWSPSLVDGFLVNLLSHPHPIHKVLKPAWLDKRDIFSTQYEGMSEKVFSYEDYESTRERLRLSVVRGISEESRKFIVSFKEGNPNWDLWTFPSIKEMPAVRWKLKNILKLKSSNLNSYRAQLKSLIDVLYD